MPTSNTQEGNEGTAPRTADQQEGDQATLTRRSGQQTDSLTLRRIAVDGLTGQAEGGRCPPAHAYAVGVPMAGRHGRVFLSSQLHP
jgi:hypothetical protein